MEDGSRAKQALERFIQLRRVNRIGDIMQYPHINSLENAMESLAGIGARRQGFAGVDPETLPGVEKWKEKEDIIFYKVTNPESLGKMGEGTKWCTRSSYNNSQSLAKHYLNKYGFLIVGYENGKPVVQLNPDYSQVMDVNDVRWQESEKNILMSMGFPEPPFPMPKYWDPDHPHYAAYSRWSNHTGNKVDFPEYPKKPEKYSITLGGEEPKDVQTLRRWGREKGKDIEDMLPEMPPEFWKIFENRVAKSILKVKSYGSILHTMRGWQKMFTLIKKRTPKVEKAILNKNWKKVNMRHFGGGGNQRHLPGMYEITEYVQDIIKGNWPEFEKKIENDVFNSVYYYNETGLNPDYIQNPKVKETVMFLKYIKDKHPSVSTEEFESALRNYLIRAKKEFKHGEIRQVLNLVLRPYMKQTGKSIKDILGKEESKPYRRAVKYVGLNEITK